MKLPYGGVTSRRDRGTSRDRGDADACAAATAAFLQPGDATPLRSCSQRRVGQRANMVDHTRYRVAYWIAAFVMIALMGGSVYGWPSLRAVLFLDAHLAEGCDEGDAVCDPQLLAGPWRPRAARSR